MAKIKASICRPGPDLHLQAQNEARRKLWLDATNCEGLQLFVLNANFDSGQPSASPFSSLSGAHWMLHAFQGSISLKPCAGLLLARQL